MNNFIKDDKLQEHLGYFEAIKDIHIRSYEKAIAHIKIFMINYADTFHKKSDVLEKMKNHKYKIMKYLQELIYRIPNDNNLQHQLEYSRDYICNLFDNYIMEASDNLNEYYFPN
tara:strand:+ start:7771 stop:8112 length:342 start_codon:yes stop_codon:yes gene_type:complete